MEYVIRDIKESEIGKLIEMCQSHAAYEKAAYDPAGKAEALKQAIFSKETKLFCKVVEAGNQLVGYFSYTFDYSTWDAEAFLHLDCLYLEPQFRGLGIGQKILDELRSIASQRNCINLQWQTPVFNLRAIKFYKRMGAEGKDKIRFFLQPYEKGITVNSEPTLKSDTN